MAEVIRRSLAIYDFLISEKSKGADFQQSTASSIQDSSDVGIELGTDLRGEPRSPVLGGENDMVEKRAKSPISESTAPRGSPKTPIPRPCKPPGAPKGPSGRRHGAQDRPKNPFERWNEVPGPVLWSFCRAR